MWWRRVLAVGLACGLVQVGLTETGVLPSHGLDRTDWRLVEFTSDGVTTPAAEGFRDQFLRFDGRGHFSGQFCNRVHGDVNVRWGVLSFGDMGGTLMGCGGLLGQVEDAFYAFGSPVRWDIDGDHLTLGWPWGKKLVFVADGSAPVRREAQVLYGGVPDGRAHVFTLRDDGPDLFGTWYFGRGRGQGWAERSAPLSQKERRVQLVAWAEGDVRPGEVLFGGFAPAGTSTVEYRATPTAEPVALVVHEGRGARWAVFHGWGPAAKAGTVTAFDAAGHRLATCTPRGSGCEEAQALVIR